MPNNTLNFHLTWSQNYFHELSAEAWKSHKKSLQERNQLHKTILNNITITRDKNNCNQ